jgi:hypothetical protein
MDEDIHRSIQEWGLNYLLGRAVENIILASNLQNSPNMLAYLAEAQRYLNIQMDKLRSSGN